MIGDVVTVQQLYDYAVQHNYLETDVKIVLDIIGRDRKKDDVGIIEHNNLVSPVSNSSAIDFSTLVEYKTEDLIALFSST